jgi:hypothetical protein
MRFEFVTGIIAIALFVGMLLSPELWMPVREFPMAPILDISLPSWFHFFLLTLSVISLVVGGIITTSGRKVAFYVFFMSMISLLCADQFRWQPWIYFYLILLLPFCVFSKDEHSKITSFQRVAIIGLYLWSGIHKINPNFLEWANEEASSQFLISFRWFGLLVSLTETVLAIGLIFSRTRTTSALLLMAMHVVIVLYFGGANTVIIPWNIASIALLYRLFIRIDKEHRKTNLLVAGMAPKLAYSCAVLWTLPFLNFFGYWDHYLAFSLYSQKAPSFFVAVEVSEVDKIKELKPYFVEIPGMTGGNLVDMNKWAFAKLNAPFYPELRVFRQVSSYFCAKAIPKEKVVFVEVVPNWSGNKEISTFYCE